MSLVFGGVLVEQKVKSHAGDEKPDGASVATVALIQWNLLVSAPSAVIAWPYASDNGIIGGFDLSYDVSSEANKSALDAKRNQMPRIEFS